jgi:predicted nucleic acid-binding protein
MSEILISNTGPLIALGLINQLGLLPTFYPQVWITETVHREISTNANKPLANLIEQCPFIQIHPDPDMPDCWLKNLLDPGEASTIALAVHHQNSLVMIDEKKGRNIAANIYQLQVIGSLGILAKAKTTGLIHSLAPLLQELKSKNYRLSDHLITRVLSDFQEEESC